MEPIQRALSRTTGGVSLSLPRIYPRRLLLALAFLMSVRAFYFFPGMSAPSEVWNVLCFLFLAFVYLAWKAKAGERFLGFEFYILLMMAAMPLWSAIMAEHVFGQPLFYGILTQRTMILGTIGLALLTFYRLGWINTRDIEQALIVCAWGTLVLYGGWGLLTLGRSEVDTSGAQVRLVYSFVEIGFLYYGLIGFNLKSKLHYALAAPFLLYMVSIGQRALLLSVVGAYGLFVLLRGSVSRLVVFVPAAIISAVALVGVLYLADANFVTSLAERFVEAFTVVTTGQSTQDLSANARLEEFAVGEPYILSSPLVGNGDISHKWHGGYEQVLQGYFFPSDIGLFGVIYMYGALGLCAFAAQFWWARKYAVGVLEGRDTPPMIDAAVAFLVAYAVQSASGGTFAFNWGVGVILIAYLYIAGDERRKAAGSGRVAKPFWSRDLQGLQRKP